MGKNEFSFPTNEDMPTENTNKKKQISKIECEEYCSYQIVN